MATEILATGSGAADSQDIVIGDGEQLTVAVKGVAQAVDCEIVIKLKDDDGGYWPVDALSWRRPGVVIVAAGTYRITRTAGSAECGVFSG